MPRYAWRDHYALLRERLDALGRRLGGSYRVLVDANHHVDRAGAERAGVGFIGKNTMLITRTHGSWVVLGTLITDVELETTAPLEAGCGSCTLCIDACPTGALSERAGRARRDPVPRVLDADRGRRSPTRRWTRSRTGSTAATSARTSVRGTAGSRSDAPAGRFPRARSPSSRSSTGSSATGGSSSRTSTGSTSRRTTPAGSGGTPSSRVGNDGRSEDEPLARRFVDDDDPVLRGAAARAVARIGTGRGA